MPLYDYRCHQCGETFEVRQRFADPVWTVHEGCGGELARLVSAPALQCKGTGCYLTDYGRNGKKPEAAGSSGKPESKSESKSEWKSETRADSKSESKSGTKTESKSDSKTETKSASKPA